MESFKYYTTDNRTVFSSRSLHYALTSSHTLNLQKLTPEDAKNISIIADNYLAEIIAAACEPNEKCFTKPSTAPSSNAWYMHNYCVMVGDHLHIRNGKEYRSLTTFMEKANIDELKYVLTQTAMQAALCRAELANASNVVAG